MTDLPAPLVDRVTALTWFTLDEVPTVNDITVTDITQVGSTVLPGSTTGVNLVFVNAPGVVNITLPLLLLLIVGQRWLIKDTSGLAGTNTITVSGNGYTIDADASFTINANYGDVELQWNGTTMSIVI